MSFSEGYSQGLHVRCTQLSIILKNHSITKMACSQTQNDEAHIKTYQISKKGIMC